MSKKKMVSQAPSRFTRRLFPLGWRSTNRIREETHGGRLSSLRVLVARKSRGQQDQRIQFREWVSSDATPKLALGWFHGPGSWINSSFILVSLMDAIPTPVCHSPFRAPPFNFFFFSFFPFSLSLPRAHELEHTIIFETIGCWSRERGNRRSGKLRVKISTCRNVSLSSFI